MSTSKKNKSIFYKFWFEPSPVLEWVFNITLVPIFSAVIFQFVVSLLNQRLDNPHIFFSILSLGTINLVTSDFWEVNNLKKPIRIIGVTASFSVVITSIFHGNPFGFFISSLAFVYCFGVFCFHRILMKGDIRPQDI